MKKLLAATALFVASTAAHADHHEEVEEAITVSPGVEAPAQRAPTDFRRSSLIVRDIDRSLALYRDVFGFEINYDTEVTMSSVALPAGEPGARARLVLVSGNDPWIGWIGLLQWLDPALPDPGPYPTRLGVGDHVMVMNTDDAVSRCAAALQVPGVSETAPARLQVYPGRGDNPPIRVIGCNIFDPDGNAIELNQLLREDEEVPPGLEQGESVDE